MKKALSQLSLLLLLIGFLSVLTSCSVRKKARSNREAEMKSTYKELKALLPEANLTMEEKERIRIVFKATPLFELNADTIKAEFLSSIANIALIMNRYPKTSVLILGYTDSTGNDGYNSKLSWRRAENAKTALLNSNLENKRAFTWGFGAQNPSATNETEEGRQLNRRTEFVILFSDQLEN